MVGDYGRDFGYIVMFVFTVGGFCGFCLAGLGFVVLRGVVGRDDSRWRSRLLLAFVLFGGGLFRGIGSRILRLVLLCHHKRNRRYREKQNGQYSHACLRRKMIGHALYLFCQSCFARASPRSTIRWPGTTRFQTFREL